MLGLLSAILCVLRNLLLAIAYAGVELVNLLVLAIGTLAAGLVALLPSMPDAPTMPASVDPALGWLSWAYPVAPALAAFAALCTMYVGFLVIRIALRWVKAL